MKPPLRLAEALTIMDASALPRGRSFELVFCTADPRRDTGGERIVFDHAVLTTQRQKSTAAAGVPAEGTPRRRYQAKRSDVRRFPVNVKNLTSQEIRKVRLDLIESVNGHPVL